VHHFDLGLTQTEGALSHHSLDGLQLLQEVVVGGREVVHESPESPLIERVGPALFGFEIHDGATQLEQILSGVFRLAFELFSVEVKRVASAG
jgi:hypothetical protein